MMSSTRSAEIAKRSVSFLKTTDADDYPIGPLMVFLILIVITEGADGALFPNTTKALERTIGFDVGVLGRLATLQFIFQASFGPFWGVMCARGFMERRTILGFCTFMQGLATFVMWYFVENEPMMWVLRAINGASLAGMRPIVNSIIGDRFGDTVRGSYFGLIAMSGAFGSTIFGAIIQFTSEWCLNNPTRLEPCEEPSTDCDGPTPAPCECGGVMGWQMAFIAIGAAVMILAPLIYLFMKAPPVKVKQVAVAKNENRVVAELKALANLFRRPTFAILVVQGCFGSIPWRAFEFRPFFFATAGLNPGQVSFVQTTAGFTGLFGAGFGGWLSDKLNQHWPLHGRVLNAEISVYAGIPFAFCIFYLDPPAQAFWWFFLLTTSMHLMAAGVAGGTNAPILSALAEEDERALILAWQTSLEGAIASMGPLIFTTLLDAFGYDKRCNDPCWEGFADNCNPDPRENARAAGLGLVFTTCVPWTICGLLYSSLHLFYPRDMENLNNAREIAAANEAPLVQELEARRQQ